jgi:hypothetical protein
MVMSISVALESAEEPSSAGMLGLENRRRCLQQPPPHCEGESAGARRASGSEQLRCQAATRCGTALVAATRPTPTDPAPQCGHHDMTPRRRRARRHGPRLTRTAAAANHRCVGRSPPWRGQMEGRCGEQEVVDGRWRVEGEMGMTARRFFWVGLVWYGPLVKVWPAAAGRGGRARW